VLKDYAVRTS